MGWLVAAAVVAALAFLVWLIDKIRELNEAGAHDRPAITEDGEAAVQELREFLEQLQDEDRDPTESECQRLNELYDRAAGGFVLPDALLPLRESIDAMCSH